MDKENIKILNVENYIRKSIRILIRISIKVYIANIAIANNNIIFYNFTSQKVFKIFFTSAIKRQKLVEVIEVSILSMGQS